MQGRMKKTSTNSNYMHSNAITRYSTILLMFFFVSVVFLALMSNVMSGYLFYSSEWKAFILDSVSVAIGVFGLIGVWKMKKWAYLPLVSLAAFGIILSIIYPPTNISGGILDKMSNLPLSLYAGVVCLLLYLVSNRKRPTNKQSTKKS